MWLQRSSAAARSPAASATDSPSPCHYSHAFRDLMWYVNLGRGAALVFAIRAGRLGSFSTRLLAEQGGRSCTEALNNCIPSALARGFLLFEGGHFYPSEEPPRPGVALVFLQVPCPVLPLGSCFQNGAWKALSLPLSASAAVSSSCQSLRFISRSLVCPFISPLHAEAGRLVLIW